MEITPLCPALQNSSIGVTACDGTNPNPPINGIAELVAFRDYDFCNIPCDTFYWQWDICCRSDLITSVAAPGSSGIALSGTLDKSLEPM